MLIDSNTPLEKQKANRYVISYLSIFDAKAWNAADDDDGLVVGIPEISTL